MPSSTPRMPDRFRPVVAVIPARGGSKGIPRKALTPLGGRPLLHHTVALALRLGRLGCLDRVLVTTEDPGIAASARRAGAEVLDRPESLATDRATGLEVLRHAVRSWGGIGTAVLLQPTSPLRNEADVVACLKRFLKGDADAVVSVTEAHPPPAWMYRMGTGGRLGKLLPERAARRQDAKKAWALNNTWGDVAFHKNRVAAFVLADDDRIGAGRTFI